MKVRLGVRLETALICAGTFLLLMVFGNPFVPDVCASSGYGYPYPVYITWCECFIENYPPSINVSYVLFDSLFWISLWWAVSSVRTSQRLARECGVIKS